MTEKGFDKFTLEENERNNEVKSYYTLKTSFKKNYKLNKEKELYVLEKEFLKKWKLFVNYKDFKEKEESNYYLNLNKNSNLHSFTHPGTINNKKLLMDVSNYYNSSNLTEEEFILKHDSEKDNLVINKAIWELFHSKYGGGPKITKNLLFIKTPYNSKYLVDIYHSQINLVVFDKELNRLNLENLHYKGILVSSFSNINQMKDKVCSIVLHNSFKKEQIKFFRFSSNLDDLRKFLTEAIQKNDNLTNIPIICENLYLLEDNQSLITKDLKGEFVLVDCIKLIDFSLDTIIEGKCNWCEDTMKLNYSCSCKEVSYCSSSCQENDKRFHIEKCKSYSGKTSIFMSSLSKNGIVGLKNLGNTCYMNTALQCISNCYELTNYFLNNHYKFHLNTTNEIGAKGLIAKSYAEVVANLWYGKEGVFSPFSFKRVIDELKSYFTGNQQHDSQEFLTYFLDQLHEDLNRVLNKTFFITTIADNEDSIKSFESWELFLKRNQSIIIDIFFGQFKSTLYCLNCENKSITFDSFSFVPLSLITKTITFEKIIYFIFYDCTIPPIKLNLLFNSDCSIMALRNKVAEIMTINPFSFVIFKLNDKGDINMFLNSSTFIKRTLEDGNHPLYLVQINPEIFYSSSKFASKSRLPTDFKKLYQELTSNIYTLEKKLIESNEENEYGQTSEEITYYSHNYESKKRNYLITKHNVDNNYGLAKNYLNTLLYMKTYCYEMKYVIEREKIVFPRMVLIDKEWSLKKIHMQIFSFIKPVLIKIENESNPNEFLNGLLQNECNDEELFNYFFQDFNTSYDNDSIEYHLSHKYPYRIRIHSLFEIEKCYYCGKRYCEDCLLPFCESITLKNFISSLPKNDDKTIDNTYYFINENQRSNYKQTEFILELTFLPKYIEGVKLLNQFNEINLNYIKKELSSEETISLNPNISVYDCFNNFVKYEILKDINEWQCQYCKKRHQQFKKKIEIYKAPHILIIQLKRFNTNLKLDTFVEFPIEGLNLDNYIISQENNEEKDQNLYDLFAVSNHLGQMGSGHYIAYAKNYYDKNWYKFDDSSVNRISEKEIVCKDAYVLFYRKRNSRLNFEDLYKQPIISYETSDFSSTATLTNRSNQ